MHTEIVEWPPKRAAAILHVGSYDKLGAAFDRLASWMGEHAADVTGVPMSVYVDDPQTTPVDQMRTYAAVSVSESAELAADGPVEALAIPGGRFLIGEHRGGYGGLGAAWQEFMGSVRSGEAHVDPDRPFFEVYVSDPSSTPEAELITQLCLPIQ